MKHKQWPNQIHVDFSADSALKDALLTKLLLELDRQPNDRTKLEGIPMKKTMKYSTRVVLIALISIVLVSAVALAALKTFSLGPFATYTATSEQEQMEQVRILMEAQRANWAGLLFDVNGQQVDDFDDLMPYFVGHGERDHIYDAQGVEQVIDFQGDEIVLRDRSEINERTFEDSEITKFAVLEDAKQYLCFDFALPSYLPDGYALDRFELFNDEDGKPFEGSKYLTIVYAKAGNTDSELHVSLRLMDEETAFESSNTGTLRELKINGRDAITDEKNLELLVNDVLYEFFPMKSGLPLDELVKMAESIEP